MTARELLENVFLYFSVFIIIVLRESLNLESQSI